MKISLITSNRTVISIRKFEASANFSFFKIRKKKRYVSFRVFHLRLENVNKTNEIEKIKHTAQKGIFN